MPNLLRRLAIDKKVAAYNFLNEYTKADEKAKGTKDDAKSGIAEDYVAHEIVMEEPKINADSDSEAAGGSFAEILEEKKKAEEPKIRPEILEEEKKILWEAKAVLMERNHMTEEEAHRYIQKCSMDSGTSLTETAQMVLSMIKL